MLQYCKEQDWNKLHVQSTIVEQQEAVDQEQQVKRRLNLSSVERMKWKDKGQEMN